MATVSEIIRARGCSTAPVKGLSEQIIDEINLIIPNVLVSIDDLDTAVALSMWDSKSLI
jgi:hypothetical protein